MEKKKKKYSMFQLIELGIFYIKPDFPRKKTLRKFKRKAHKALFLKTIPK